MFQPEIKKKHLTLSWSFNCVPYVNIDSDRVSQIIINLLSNAIKFTPSGSIMIRCETRSMDDKMMLQIAVQDSGVGLSSQETQFLFNRFAQATQRTYAEYGGSGLGLFICKNLVELMNGQIWVESTKGSTTTFTFTIPCEPVPTNYHEHDSKSVHNEMENYKAIQSVTVLVVEDNKINQKVLMRMLEKAGCKCVTANDGVEGFEKYMEQPFDLVFMDIAMPRMDGYECTRKIRELPTGKDAVVIGLSGNVRQEYHDKAREVGMTLYLNKPVLQVDIERVVKQFKKEKK